MAKLMFVGLASNSGLAVIRGVLDSGKVIVESWNADTLRHVIKNNLFTRNFENARECQNALNAIEWGM